MNSQVYIQEQSANTSVVAFPHSLPAATSAKVGLEPARSIGIGAGAYCRLTVKQQPDKSLRVPYYKKVARNKPACVVSLDCVTAHQDAASFAVLS